MAQAAGARGLVHGVGNPVFCHLSDVSVALPGNCRAETSQRCQPSASFCWTLLIGNYLKPSLGGQVAGSDRVAALCAQERLVELGWSRLAPFKGRCSPATWPGGCWSLRLGGSFVWGSAQHPSALPR